MASDCHISCKAKWIRKFKCTLTGHIRCSQWRCYGSGLPRSRAVVSDVFRAKKAKKSESMSVCLLRRQAIQSSETSVTTHRTVNSCLRIIVAYLQSNHPPPLHAFDGTTLFISVFTKADISTLYFPSPFSLYPFWQHYPFACVCVYCVFSYLQIFPTKTMYSFLMNIKRVESSGLFCFDPSNSVGVKWSSYECFAQLSLSIWHCRSQILTFHLSHLNGP